MVEICTSWSQNPSELERTTEVFIKDLSRHLKNGASQLIFNYSGLIVQLADFSCFLFLLSSHCLPFCCIRSMSLAPPPDTGQGQRKIKTGY